LSLPASIWHRPTLQEEEEAAAEEEEEEEAMRAAAERRAEGRRCSLSMREDGLGSPG
jgi:hypothetical protein